jgi:hypothetical protein
MGSPKAVSSWIALLALLYVVPEDPLIRIEIGVRSFTAS